MSALGTTVRLGHTAHTVAVIDYVVSAAVTVATVRARRGFAALSGTGRRSALHEDVACAGPGPGASAGIEQGGARIYQLPVRPSTSGPVSGPVSGRSATVIPLRG